LKALAHGVLPCKNSLTKLLNQHKAKNAPACALFVSEQWRRLKVPVEHERFSTARRAVGSKSLCTSPKEKGNPRVALFDRASTAGIS